MSPAPRKAKLGSMSLDEALAWLSLIVLLAAFLSPLVAWWLWLQ
jgi:hypothetical protein